MSEEELCREIKSGAFSMQVADCERNIRIQFEQLQQENKKLKEIIDKSIEYIDDWLFNVGGMGACMDYKDIKEILDILKGVE